jgi:hypothetical protein
MGRFRQDCSPLRRAFSPASSLPGRQSWSGASRPVSGSASMTDVLRTTFVSLRSLLRGFGPSSRRGSARGHDRVSVAHVRGIRRARSSACLRAIRGHIIMDSLRGRRFKHHALPGLSTLHPTQLDGRGMHHSVPRRRGLSVYHSIRLLASALYFIGMSWWSSVEHVVAITHS